ncbi:glutamate-rich protein 1 isoform X2 [Hypomesus transpacificus]|uniref:glutamate-rich protein 1 isoform X2 n=1 Tax=Hypomesus transpacificus TaxID=137520 RepID=UPI001F086CC4|nr:glutamate-rich protein 1 isoform X2 [Hypomesus transpacificus]
MPHRKDVFQSKVLQKLYPSPPKPDQIPNTPPTLTTVSKKPKVQHESGDEGLLPGQPPPGKRVYTALPPPEGYLTGAEGSVTLSQPTGMNTAGHPAEEISSQSREDDDDDNDNEEEEEKEKEEEEQQRRRRRRRKIKKLEHASGARSVKVKTGQAGESNTDRPGLDATVEGGGEQLSKNKRRKLKKKRHREKLISMGLVPRAAALEFTYQREGDVEEEEEDEEVLERRSLEVSEFLKTTLGFYVSEPSAPAERPHVPLAVFEGLLSRVSGRTAPPSALRQLHTLKAQVQLKDTVRLANALEDFQSKSSLSPDETTAVVRLIQYWITDILTL